MTLILALCEQRRMLGSDPEPVAALLISAWDRISTTNFTPWPTGSAASPPRPWTRADGSQPQWVVQGLVVRGAIGGSRDASPERALELFRSAALGVAWRGDQERAVELVNAMWRIADTYRWPSHDRARLLSVLAHLPAPPVEVLEARVRAAIDAGKLRLADGADVLAAVGLDPEAFVAGYRSDPLLGTLARQLEFDGLPAGERIELLRVRLAEGDTDVREQLFGLLVGEGRIDETADLALDLAATMPDEVGWIGEMLAQSTEDRSIAAADRFLGQWVESVDPTNDLMVDFIQDFEATDLPLLARHVDRALERTFDAGDGAFDALRRRSAVAASLDRMGRIGGLSPLSMRALRRICDDPLDEAEWEHAVSAALRSGDWKLARRATDRLHARASVADQTELDLEDIELAKDQLADGKLPWFVELD
ncbi:hypothetical protein [Engelhardtia mirabilis]